MSRPIIQGYLARKLEHPALDHEYEALAEAARQLLEMRVAIGADRARTSDSLVLPAGLLRALVLLTQQLILKRLVAINAEIEATIPRRPGPKRSVTVTQIEQRLQKIRQSRSNGGPKRGRPIKHGEKELRTLVESVARLKREGKSHIGDRILTDKAALEWIVRDEWTRRGKRWPTPGAMAPKIKTLRNALARARKVLK
jgi:hypothetical protein